MRELENKTTKLTNGAIGTSEGKAMSYVDLINVCLNVPVEGGMGIDEMQARLRIHSSVSGSNGKIKLEDADHDKLNAIVKASKWPAMHKDIITFTEDVENAKTVKK